MDYYYFYNYHICICRSVKCPKPRLDGHFSHSDKYIYENSKIHKLVITKLLLLLIFFFFLLLFFSGDEFSFPNRDILYHHLRDELESDEHIISVEDANFLHESTCNDSVLPSKGRRRSDRVTQRS